LGVVDSALRRWVKQLEAERQGVTPKSKALTPEQQTMWRGLATTSTVFDGGVSMLAAWRYAARSTSCSA
ncbi:transposase, partial [Pseudomonas aeruginosa]